MYGVYSFLVNYRSTFLLVIGNCILQETKKQKQTTKLKINIHDIGLTISHANCFGPLRLGLIAINQSHIMATNLVVSRIRIFQNYFLSNLTNLITNDVSAIYFEMIVIRIAMNEIKEIIFIMKYYKRKDKCPYIYMEWKSFSNFNNISCTFQC